MSGVTVREARPSEDIAFVAEVDDMCHRTQEGILQALIHHRVPKHVDFSNMRSVRTYVFELHRPMRPRRFRTERIGYACVAQHKQSWKRRKGAKGSLSARDNVGEIFNLCLHPKYHGRHMTPQRGRRYSDAVLGALLGSLRQTPHEPNAHVVVEIDSHGTTEGNVLRLVRFYTRAGFRFHELYGGRFPGMYCPIPDA